jgi:hypothetical protein
MNGIIKGDVAITPDTALQLERVLGVSASFWSGLESRYQEFKVRKQEEEALEKQKAWLRKFPVSEMVKMGWLEATKEPALQIQALLSFFGIASPEQFASVLDRCHFETDFRRDKKVSTDWPSIAAWLRKGKLKAQEIDCAEFDPTELRTTLAKVRHLTTQDPEVFVPAVVDLCRRVGVAVVFVKQLPRTRTSGAARWLTATKAMIQLSLRYKWNDQIWFTFFHEAAHLLLHGKRLIFLDEDKPGSSTVEKEANEFAAQTLISEEEIQRFLSLSGRITKAQIRTFSYELGIAPGIVVGRLQHDKRLPYRQCNDLKVQYDWSNGT